MDLCKQLFNVAEILVASLSTSMTYLKFSVLGAAKTFAKVNLSVEVLCTKPNLEDQKLLNQGAINTRLYAVCREPL